MMAKKWYRFPCVISEDHFLVHIHRCGPDTCAMGRHGGGGDGGARVAPRLDVFHARRGGA